jgi:hypothetical protein
MGVAPRSEAMEKYAMAAVVRIITGRWWKTRVPSGRRKARKRKARSARPMMAKTAQRKSVAAWLMSMVATVGLTAMDWG